MKRMMFFWFLLTTLAACSSGPLIYSERNYDRLNHERNIEIRIIDGKIYRFYRVEIIQFDDKEIRMKTWMKKDSQPVEYIFQSREILIRKAENPYGQTISQIASLAAVIAILALLNHWLY